MTSSSKGGKDEVTMSLIIVVIVFTLCQLTNPVSKAVSGSKCLVTVRKRSCGKIMFLHLSGILFKGRGEEVSLGQTP